MDYKKTTAPHNTITRDMNKLCDEIGNVYETVAIISKRSNEISQELKKELDAKLQEFSTPNDNSLDEMAENKEQIDISRRYESLPKPTLIAIQEFEDKQIYYHTVLVGVGIGADEVESVAEISVKLLQLFFQVLEVDAHFPAVEGGRILEVVAKTFLPKNSKIVGERHPLITPRGCIGRISQQIVRQLLGDVNLFAVNRRGCNVFALGIAARRNKRQRKK